MNFALYCGWVLRQFDFIGVVAAVWVSLIVVFAVSVSPVPLFVSCEAGSEVSVFSII